MVDRDRSAGWSYAKKSGHQNETNIFNLLKNDLEFKESLEFILKSNIKDFNIGGLNEKSVVSVFNKSLTKSKTDLKIISDNRTFNFSIKKSRGGQVYLITIPRFINGIKKHETGIRIMIVTGIGFGIIVILYLVNTIKCIRFVM